MTDDSLNYDSRNEIDDVNNCIDLDDENDHFCKNSIKTGNEDMFDNFDYEQTRKLSNNSYLNTPISQTSSPVSLSLRCSPRNSPILQKQLQNKRCKYFSYNSLIKINLLFCKKLCI